MPEFSIKSNEFRQNCNSCATIIESIDEEKVILAGVIDDLELRLPLLNHCDGFIRKLTFEKKEEREVSFENCLKLFP